MTRPRRVPSACPLTIRFSGQRRHTYGIACKAIVDAFLDSDVSRVHSCGARFAGVAYPGEMLVARIWEEDGRLVATVTAPTCHDAVVLSGVELIPA
jgi:acyl dehydratase